MALDLGILERPATPPPVVTIVDDDPLAREEIAMWVEKAGWSARPLDRRYGADVDGLVREAESATNIVICDQNLNAHSYLATTGIEVAKRLLAHHVPTVLISQNLSEVSRYDSILPVISRMDLGKAKLNSALKLGRTNTFEASDFLHRFYRSIIEVSSIDATKNIVNFIVTGWPSDEPVAVEQRWIPETLHEHLAPGALFLAQARLHARKPDDMVLRDFELAPEPDPDDGLA